MKRCKNCKHWSGKKVTNPYRPHKEARICVSHHARGFEPELCVMDEGGLCYKWQSVDAEKEGKL